MNQDTLSAIEEEIFQIRGRIAEKKKILKELNAEAERHLRERDAIHERIWDIRSRNAETIEKIKVLREEIIGIREKLKSLSPEIQKRRIEKEQIIQQLGPIRQENLSEPQIVKRIRELEERIETEPLRPEEERRLYEEIKRLNKLLVEARRRIELSSRLKAVKDEVATLRGDAQSMREMLSAKVDELNKLREGLNTVMDSIRKLKPEADSHHQAYLEVKKKMQVVEAEIILLSSRLYELQDMVRKQKEEQARNRENAMKEKLRSQAMQKISAGGKLSFEEMKLLLEDESAWTLIAKGVNNKKA
jgi:uncharacterized coiled-coil DUF342 family protein